MVFQGKGWVLEELQMEGEGAVLVAKAVMVQLPRAEQPMVR
jgi:hypothetical protein